MTSALRVKALCGLALAVSLLTQSAQGCRFSVRDLGFVDRPDTAPTLLLRGDAAVVDDAASSVRRSLARVGIRAAVVAEAGSGPLSLLARQGDERLELGEAPSTSAEGIAALAVEAVALTPLGDELLPQLIEKPCIVLVTHPGDDASALPARRAVEAAEEGVSDAIADSRLWAKPMVGEPVCRVVDPAEIDQNRFLLWSLGLRDTHQPSAVVVYGRLRQVGGVLQGDSLTPAGVRRAIGALGKDCECDLDGAILEGPGALHPWTDALAVTASEALGFDPQHPMTEIEIRQILARKRSSSNESGRDLNLLQGYEEVDFTATVNGDRSSGEVAARPEAMATKPASAQAEEPSELAEAGPEGEDPQSSVMTLAVGLLALTAVSAGAGWTCLRLSAGTRS